MAIGTTTILTTLIVIPAPIAIASTPKTTHGMTVVSILALLTTIPMHLNLGMNAKAIATIVDVAMVKTVIIIITATTTATSSAITTTITTTITLVVATTTTTTTTTAVTTTIRIAITTTVLTLTTTSTITMLVITTLTILKQDSWCLHHTQLFSFVVP
jgi:hypothetical protein